MDRARLRAVWHSPRFWLAVFISVFFAASLWTGAAAYFDLSNRLGAGNLSINMQALSSSAHGYIPFYEAPDCAAKERCSFLLVHPGFAVLYPMVPFYGSWPSPVTIFAFQSLAVALAAIPLYSLTRQVTGSSWKALFAGGLYLVWAPLLAGEAFSFGLESFLPLELFTIAALWQAKRYRLGFAAATISFLTFEITPIFVFLLGLFFLTPALGRIFRSARQRWRDWRRGAIEIAAAIAAWARSTIQQIHERDVGATIALMLYSVASLVLVFLFMNVVGAQILGAPIPATNYGLSSLFYDNSGSQQGGLPLSVALRSPGLWILSAQTPLTAAYWVILFALMGFIPLLSPRSLILSVPWIGYTFLSDSNRFTFIGALGDSIAAAPLFIGLAYGLCKVPFGELRASKIQSSGVGEEPNPGTGGTPSARRRKSGTAALGIFALCAVVVANVLLSSSCPILPALGFNPGQPFRGGYYFSPSSGNSGFNGVEAMVGSIPSTASIGAATDLFQFVANDLHAYILTPHFVADRLPFNVSGGPDYLLLDGFGGYLPPSLAATLTNGSVYGVSGFVAVTTVGPVLLFEKGYHSTAAPYGPSWSAPATTYLPGNGLVPGAEGVEEPTASTRSGEMIASKANLTQGGVVLTSATQFLGPGSYDVVIVANITPLHGGGPKGATVLNFDVQGFAGFLVSHSYAAGTFTVDQWTTLSFTMKSPNPVLFTEFVARLLDVRYSLAIAEVSIQPVRDS